ncbi:hypothetical protein BHC44_00445 [Snodgrassella alvi]|nr:hypothetical protein BHC44_00445 [Snodgrassella alvi]
MQIDSDDMGNITICLGKIFHTIAKNYRVIAYGYSIDITKIVNILLIMDKLGSSLRKKGYSKKACQEQ